MEVEIILVLESDEDLDEKELSDYQQALRFFTVACFEESQVRCPVRTGNLVRSGRLEESYDEAYFTYDAPYAEVIERGRGQPGEKSYFPGYRFIDGAIDELEPRFSEFLVQALQRDYDIFEETM